MIGFFYDLFYILPLDIALVLSFLQYLGKKEISLAACLMSSVTVIFLLILRHSGKKERCLIGGGAAFALAGLFWVMGEERREILIKEYGFLGWILILTLFCIVIGKLAEKALWLRIIVSVTVVVNLIYLMISKIAISKVAVAASFLVLMIYILEIVQKYWKKSGYTEIKGHITLITPVILIVTILTCMIPAPVEAFDWSIAKDIWKKTVTEYMRISGYLTGQNDDYSYVGFSEEGSIASEIASNDKDVMTVYGIKSDDSLYMAGICFENFVNNEWETGPAEENNYRQFDYLETRTAISQYDPGHDSDYMLGENVRVESKLFNTRHIFLPGKVNFDSRNTDIPKYTETEESLLTNSKIRYGDSYSMDYYRLNFENPKMIEIINSDTPISENEWNTSLIKTSAGDREKVSYENYLKYRESIYEKYGPKEGLSPELEQIVKELFEGVDGNYERLKVLAEYMQTFEYNTNPGLIPSGIDSASDYLDYFILKSQSGYCVHYATAFVLLARECGYPARYVQGYYVKRTGNSTEVEVRERRAHSWAEVYLDNFGWLVFEATPGYETAGGWSVNGRSDGKGKNGFTPYIPEDANTEINLEAIPQEESRETIHPSYFIIPILLALFFGAVFIIINRLITNYRYRKLNSEEKVLYIIRHNLRILKILGYPISSFETIAEFRQRVIGDLPEKESSLGFLEIYEKILYSDYEICDSDLLHVREDYEGLKNMLKQRGFRYRFYFILR